MWVHSGNLHPLLEAHRRDAFRPVLPSQLRVVVVHNGKLLDDQLAAEPFQEPRELHSVPLAFARPK